MFLGEAPAALSYWTNKPCTAYNFRRSNNILIVARFNPQFLKTSRGAILWNPVSTHFTDQVTVFFSQSEEGLFFLKKLEPQCIFLVFFIEAVFCKQCYPYF